MKTLHDLLHFLLFSQIKIGGGGQIDRPPPVRYMGKKHPIRSKVNEKNKKLMRYNAFENSFPLISKSAKCILVLKKNLIRVKQI